MTIPIPHRNASTGGSAKPRTSRAAPIRTVTRKGWHRPQDRWQVRDQEFIISFRDRPTWDDWVHNGGAWHSAKANDWAIRKLKTSVSEERAKASLRRIITKPRRTAKGTR